MLVTETGLFARDGDEATDIGTRGSSGLVLLAGFFVKAALLFSFPALYGGDTVLHLRNYKHVLLGHQFPMLQILVYLTHRITQAPLAVRMVMVSIGSLAGVGFYLLCRRLTNPQAALWAALFFVTTPFLNELSIVPFQETLMLAALCFSLYFYFDNRLVPASLVFAAACFTRQEAWLICPILIFDYLRQKGFGLRHALYAGALFGFAPLLWIAAHLGLSSTGTYTVEVPHSAARLVRWAYLGWICVKQIALPVLALAVAALVWGYRLRATKTRAVFASGGFLLLYLAALLFSAHGIGHPGRPNPELFVTAREATLLVGFILLLSAFGLQRLFVDQRWRKATMLAASLAILTGLLQSSWLVATETSQPDVRLSYEVAVFLQSQATNKEKVLIVARPFTSEDWKPYLEKAGQLQGAEGFAAAYRLLQEQDLSPMNLQRTAIQTSLPQDSFVAAADPKDVNWLVIWNDVAEPPQVYTALPLFHKVRELEAGSLAVTIWKRF